MEGTPSIGSQPGALPQAGARTTGKADFGQTLSRYLDEVNQLQQEADRALTGLARGNLDSLHHVVVAMSEADLSFRLMMQIRNKLVEAYKEIMRMQV